MGDLIETRAALRIELVEVKRDHADAQAALASAENAAAAHRIYLRQAQEQAGRACANSKIASIKETVGP